MITLKATINNDKMTLEEVPVQEYQINTAEIKFVFDDSWKDYNKYVIFDNKVQHLKQQIKDNTCIIPSALTKGFVTIQVFGEKIENGLLTKRQPTNTATFSIVQSINPDGTEGDKWDLYLTKIENYAKEVEKYQNLVTENEKNVTERLDNNDTKQTEQDTLISQNTENIANNKSDISNLQAEDAELQNQIASNSDRVTSLESDNITNKSDISSIKKEQTSQNNSISDLKEKDTNLQNQIDTNRNNIADISGKIPNQATSTNQLADKDFVNSSIATNTATFKGNFNSLDELNKATADINDYANLVSEEGGQTFYSRYTYDGKKWVENFKVNNTTFTAEQWKTLNSKATEELIAQISTNKNNITSHETRIKNLETDNAQNKKDIKNHTTRIENLESDNTTQKEDISKIKEEQTLQNTQIQDVTDRVSTLEQVEKAGNLNWSQIDEISQSGQASKYFKIGDQLTENWTENYNNTDTKYEDVPLNVVHFGKYQNENDEEKNGMYLEWNYLTPHGYEFCVPQALQKFDGTDGTPDGLPAGKYCFLVNSFTNEWSKVNSIFLNKYLHFELTKDIPSGGLICSNIIGKYDVWKLTTQSSIYRNLSQNIETVTVTASDTIQEGYTYLGATCGEDVGYGVLNHIEAVANGDNTWRDSDLRQWLNSDEEDWWKPITRYNRQPEYATQVKGFLTGYSEEFKSKLKTVRVGSYTNSVKEKEGLVYTYDKIFLHSLSQRKTDYNNDVQNATTYPEGEPWDYYVKLTEQETNLINGKFRLWNIYPILKRYGLDNKRASRLYFSRSARRNFAYNLWVVYDSGRPHNIAANIDGRCLPACVI